MPTANRTRTAGWSIGADDEQDSLTVDERAKMAAVAASLSDTSITMPSSKARPSSPQVQSVVELPVIRTVRDTFSMPATDHALIDHAIERGMMMRRALSKSEVVRAALHLLASIDDTSFLAAVEGVRATPPGRKKAR
jgi:hypothetical protein